MLDWFTLPQSDRSRIWVKGTEIERCFPDGFRHRFAIYSVRTVERVWQNIHGQRKLAMEYDVKYRVRDVEAADDAHFRAGKPAPIFGEYATIEEALAAIEPHKIIADDAYYGYERY